MTIRLQLKKGGVSMFLVVITCSLVALMVASFLRLMIRDQQQVSKHDLSQSAYDSAQVGIEDAKRFLSIYQKECAGGFDLTPIKCQKMETEISKTGAAGSCNMLHAAGIGAATGESVVSTREDDESLNQAYTCVKIHRDTPDYLGKADAGKAHIIPLKGIQNFSKVRLSWHTTEDMTNKDRNVWLNTVNYLEDGEEGNHLLLNRSEWNKKENVPAILKAQFFGYNQGANGDIYNGLDNDSFAKNGNGLSEQIYYPAQGAEAHLEHSLPASRRGDSKALRTNNVSLVRCKEDFARTGGLYACSVTVKLGHAVQANDIAFLRLTPFYRGANFKLELLDDGNNIVNFRGVQPKVDSTGRANDQFRRVESRLTFDENYLPVPDFAVQVEGTETPLCKDFWVSYIKNSGQAHLECK
ncbi:TPA: hypothetical protein U2D08_000443 [Streptococcus suis]|nr:hypothetical protein [Streptococcus suis]